MRKLLITKRLTALLWALVLTLMPMSLMADNTPLKVTVTYQEGSFAGEKASNAFDGNPETKWCGGIRTQSNTNAFVQMLLDKTSKLDYYYLYTGNDINHENSDGKQQRNPKEWKLYAKGNSSDEWTLISHVTDAGLPTTVSTRSNNYKIDAAYQNIEYNFLKFEILQVEQGTIFEVGEICFINCNHTFGELIPAKEPTCTEAGNIAYGQCTDCHKYIDEEGNELAEGDCVIPALGHDIQWVMKQELTCTQNEINVEQCSRCDHIGARVETIAPGHRFEIYSVDVEPTCTKSGTSTYKCRNCDETEVRTTNPQHNFGDDLKCMNCDYYVDADCVIEYTATERLSYMLEEDPRGEIYNEVFDYTDKDPYYDEYENFGEELFGAPAIMHEYDEATGKGRIICNAHVTDFLYFTASHRERLTSITLPSTVTDIGEEAFWGCYNLTSITYLAEYSDELNYWSDFEGCINLKEIIVPYNSYHKYVEMYLDEDDEEYEDYYGHIKALFKSLLPLDDTKEFQTPAIVTKVDATLQRSFANDGWYSLCLPFYVSVEDSPFSQVAAFDKLDGDTYKFKTVDIILPGMPYIVKVDAAVANHTFKNVFITTEAPATDGDFIGVYSPTELSAGCKVIGSGTTVNPVNPGTMKGFRCYFKPSQAGAKTMYFSVDDGVATSIQSLTEAEGYKLKAEGTFNLSGQKVDDSYRGIVVKNGKKFMNKQI